MKIQLFGFSEQLPPKYIVKGFVLDDEHLKNPDKGRDYFDELTLRLQAGSQPVVAHAMVIEKANLSRFDSGHRTEDHFVDVNEMIDIGKGGHGQSKPCMT